MATQLSGTYNPSVPQANQQVNNTQHPIEINFQDISELVGVNHVPFNTANDFGKHNFVTYYNQTSAPGASTNQMVMFSQASSSGTQLFYQYPNSSTVNQLTGGSGTTPSGNGAGYVNTGNGYASGYQYLSGPILMQFGLISLTAVPSTNINYSGTQTFSWTNLNYQVAFTQTPFYIECIPWFVGTGGIPATSNAYSTGFVDIIAVDNLTFNITIQNSSGNTFQVMAIGI
jgi:hypothetical protein